MSLQEATISQDTNSFVVFDVISHLHLQIHGTFTVHQGIQMGEKAKRTYKTSLQPLIPEWGRNAKLVEIGHGPAMC